ncbi:hypothetical protein D1007_30630 [Hordeum vulgare]|nr:hypothetical protein D1007_30630 [Hordeum vulgare]
MVKQEHDDMVADLESSLAWSCTEYVAQKMERERRGVEEIAERRHDRDVGGVIMLSDSDEEVTSSSMSFRSGDPGQGCSQDASKDGSPSDDDDDDGGVTTPSCTTSST